MLLEENYKFVSQMLHYSNKFNNFIVCHHKVKLSFHITMTIFLFKTPHYVLQMCPTTLNRPVCLSAKYFVKLLTISQKLINHCIQWRNLQIII